MLKFFKNNWHAFDIIYLCAIMWVLPIIIYSNDEYYIGLMSWFFVVMHNIVERQINKI